MTTNRDLGTVALGLVDLLPSFAPVGSRLGEVRPGGGNAGFSYLFVVEEPVGPRPLFLRLAPPGVRRAGTADVFRQSTALRALDRTEVPHPVVVTDGESPVLGDYLITSVVAGSNRGGLGSLAGFDAERLDAMATRAVDALIGIHGVLPGPELHRLGGVQGPEEQVTRWDPFIDRGAYADELGAEFARVRSMLLDTVPRDARMSLTHGDFQFGNLMLTDDGELTAVIDWELCGVAPSLGDLGWFMAFNDREAWGAVARESAHYFTADDLRSRYEAAGGDTEGVAWFQALAHYKYAVITSLNLSLHRRGRRDDPEWEVRGPGAFSNIAHSARILNRG